MKCMKRLFIPLALSGIFLLSGCDSDTDMAELMGAGEFEQTYDISGDYSVLDIKVSIAELTIQTGDEVSMEVHMSKWYKMEKVLQDDTLYLTEKNDGPFWQKIIHFGTVKNSVLITLPEDIVEQLVVSSSNGKVSISDLVIDNMSVSDSNGNITISNCQSTAVETENRNGGVFIDGLTAELTADLSNGNLEITNSELASLNAQNRNGKITVSDVQIPTVEVGAKNGKVVFEQTRTDSITVNTTNGSIALELNGDEKSYNYKIDSSNGKIRIGQNSFGSMSEELVLNNDADKDVVLDSANGSCTITFFQETE